MGFEVTSRKENALVSSTAYGRPMCYPLCRYASLGHQVIPLCHP